MGPLLSSSDNTKSNIIVGVVSHKKNQNDGDTPAKALGHIQRTQVVQAEPAVCDRGYRGRKMIGMTEIILPASPLKRDKRTSATRSENDVADALRSNR